MKPLATTRQVLTWLCIFQPDNSVGNMKKLLYTVFSLGLFGFLVCQVISSACFFLRFVAVDMETSLYAIYPICSWTSASYVFVVAYISRHKISSLFTELTAIFDTSTSQFFRCFHFEFLTDFILHSAKDKDSVEFLMQGDNKSELIWKDYFKYAVGCCGCISTVFGCVFSLMFSYYTFGSLHREVLFIPFKLM